MKIALVQSDIQRGAVVANLAHVSTLMDSVSGVSLYVLPEMFCIGFYPDPTPIALRMDSEAVEWIKEQATARKAAVTGSMPIVEEGRYYNRMFFALPDGTLTWYDKRHLFTYGHEDAHYSGGKERVVVEHEGVRFLLQVCYDLRFPVFSRNTGDDYDVMLYVANWPDSRIAVWDVLTQARAIENQCYVIGVNRVGKDDWGRYSGHSMAVDYLGKIQTTCLKEVPSVVVASIDIEGLRKFRSKFPVLQDADQFRLL